MAEKVFFVTKEMKPLLFRMPSRNYTFPENCGPYRYFSIGNGPVYDYGSNIWFLRGDGMTLAI